MLAYHPMLAQTDTDKFISYFYVQVCFWAVGQHCTSNVLTQCCFTTHPNNFGHTIFLCNASSHSDNIAQGFYLSNGCPKSIKTTLNINFSYEILPGASKTTLHKVFPVQCCPRRYFWEDIAQIKTLCSVIQEAPSKTAVKTLCNVVLEAPDNNVQEKVLFVFVLILFVQHRTGQIPMQCCPKDSRPHCI